MTAYCGCDQPIMDAEHDAGCRRCGNPVDFTPAGPDAADLQADLRPSKPAVRPGRHDHAARRRAQRRGRERGCWVYIPAEQLALAEFPPDAPPPWYRVWGGRRGRFVVVVYPEA